MAYHVEGGDLIIDGFEKGIGASPYLGLTDMRNIDIITVPGEAPIGFATSSQIPISTGVAITSYSNATVSFATIATAITPGTAIFFVSVGSLTGISTATPYWVNSSTTNSVTLSSTYHTNTAISVGGTAGGANFSTYTVGVTPGGVNVGGLNWFAFDGTYYWGLDAIGQVWSNITPLGTVGTTWSYTGNKIPDTAYTSGNGLVFYEGTDGKGWLFVFHNSSIDYIETDSISTGWKYGWQPSSGMLNGYSATPFKTLNSVSGFTGSHMAIVGQDNAIYYCDGNTVGSIVATNTSGHPFSPLDTASYTWNGGGNVSNGAGKYALQLPVLDNANCLAELGITLLVGGQRNYIYPWNRTASSFSYPILLAESNIAKMITVNTNTYIFVGNRGRIYITNGTQAQLAYKIPDHISGTIEPYFFWGGVAFNRNELYFGAYATKNDGTALATGNNAYGGVWAVNLDSSAIRLINQLSYGTYAGYASALIAQVQPITGLSGPFTKPAGAGLYIGWASGTPGTGGVTYGIDATTTNPYTGGQAYVISDMIPVGTLLEKKTPKQFEFKLSTPLANGESIELLAASSLNGSFTSIGSTSGGTSGTVLSDNYPTKVQTLQWLLVKAISTGTTGTPTYNRLTQIRVKGITPR